MLEPKRCPICDKEFYPKPGWVYKSDGATLCSWKCFREAERKGKPTMPKYHRSVKVEQLTLDKKVVREFASAKEAAEYVGGSYSRMVQACRNDLLYHGHKWRYKKDEVPEVSK